MANAVMILTRTASTNVDSYNRAAVSVADVNNGAVVDLTGLSTARGQSEVFTAAASSSAGKGKWMAYSPEIVSIVTSTGGVYRGLDVDPRNFTNVKARPYDVFKPVAGDIIEITEDGITSKAALVVGNFAEAAAASTLTKATSQTADTLSFKVIAVKKMTIANGQIGVGEGITSYLLECVAN
ncbi:MAG: hypothetical protein ACRCS6_13440 [Turicibacter sp.]